MCLDFYMYAGRWALFMPFFLDLLYLPFMYVVYPYVVYTSLPFFFSVLVCVLC